MAVVTLSHAPPEQRVYVYPTNIKIPTTKKRRLTFVLRGRPMLKIENTQERLE